jgi:hypothetical protein
MATTSSAHILLRRPNGGPLSWQRSNKKKIADAHANPNVTMGRNISLGTLRSLDAKPRLAKALSGT